MMNKGVLGSILFFMLVSSVLVESRPLDLTKTEEKKLVAGFFDGLVIYNVVDSNNMFRFDKHSGPSPSGPGH
ncbi:hypothetical protein Bca52824_012350 [Brassica carinata]|uniref:Uncharacterized protein n=1 Tax=Brassica carinata TaxID=52824 RepID=A0A8X8B2X6_BRACI|nr:hypothetical protein Bca52824_012350 [Brassica carinata]